MSPKLSARLGSLAVAAVVSAVAAPASAGAVDPAPVRPNQYFQGLVNGVAGHATLKMACFGPVYPGQTGHPMEGQTVEVRPAISTWATRPGYTGTAANAIVLSGGGPSATLPVTLRYYGVPVEIPVSMTFPCYGTGLLSFVPSPSSPSARAATVQVDFVGQP
ncbi:hypothetical protein [Microbispora sp. NPDC049125]|uniref:hypothetical protein n=1 Tax=Microbispora sp. NPDC049125 TaxID=3154929 RepID=UPI003466A6F2